MNINQEILSSGKIFPKDVNKKKFIPHNYKKSDKISRTEFLKIFDNIPSYPHEDYPFKDISFKNKFTPLVIPQPVYSPILSFNNIPVPEYFNHFDIDKENNRSWKNFFKEFSPKSSKAWPIKKWLSESFKSFQKQIEKLGQSYLYDVSSLVSDFSNENLFLSESPYCTIDALPLFWASSNGRFAEESFNLLMLILYKKIPEIYQIENCLSWLSYYEFKSFLDLKQPVQFKKFSSEFSEFYNNFKPKYIKPSDTLGIFLNISYQDVDESTDHIDIPFTKKSLDELNEYITSVNYFAELFSNILSEPLGSIFPIDLDYDEYYGPEMTLINTNTKEVLTQDNLYEKEDIYWKIFFNYYFPDNFKTNWKLKED